MRSYCDQFFSVFNGRINAVIHVYLDESGTHDPTGRAPGARTPLVMGFMGRSESWIAFNKSWQAILDKFGINYFHFNEFSAVKSHSLKTAWPYYGWTQQKRDDFLYSLAKIAGSKHLVLVGGGIDALQTNENVQRLPDSPIKQYRIRYPYKDCIRALYKTIIKQSEKHWPLLDRKIALIFDQCEQPNWRASIGSIHEEYRAKDPRFDTISFADSRDKPPLQAADMVAYRSRQLAEKFALGDTLQDNVSKLDNLIYANLT
jgi:Protein of unknown function (DUF3800)